MLDAGGGLAAGVLALASIGFDVELHPTGHVVPDARATARYDRLATVYDTLYPLLKETMHTLDALREQQP